MKFSFFGKICLVAFLLSAVGGVIGFLVFYFPQLANQLIAGYQWGRILISIIIELLKVLGIASISTLFFASIPGMRMMQLPVMEVLRDK